jgi:hypothetical protein
MSIRPIRTPSADRRRASGLLRAFCAGAALLLAAGCDDTTGVLLHIRGGALAESVRVSATTPLGTVEHTLTPPAREHWTLSFIATFRPTIGTVSFTVEPLVAGKADATCTSGAIRVPPHRVVSADVDCDPTSPDGPTIERDYFAAVLADNPLAYYHLGEAAGPDAADATGNHQTGSYGASVARHQPSPLANPQALGDGAAGFPGGPASAVAAVRATGSALLPSRALAVELWLTSAGGNQDAVLVQYDYVSAKVVPVYSLTLRSNHLVFYVHADGRTDQSTLTSNVSVAPGVRHHVVGTYDQATHMMALWIDGVVDTSIGGNYGDIVHGDPGTSGVGIGGPHNDSDAAFSWNGVLDEVAIYGQALSPERVVAHYLSGIQP